MYYHALFDEQDIRKMGNLIVYLPLSYIFIFIGSTCIMGFPFLTGFYSKDLILEFTFSRYLLDGLFIYILGLFAAFFTALYSSRMLLFIFILNNNSNSNKILNEYREKYDSLFLTNYRDNNRKRISFTLVYTLINYSIIKWIKDNDYLLI